MVLDKKASSPGSALKSKPKGVPEVDCDLILDTEIDRLLDEKAAKANLSVFNVKSLLRHLITNESVQKVLEYKMKQNDEKSNGQTDTAAGFDSENPVFSFEPKLTRAKTKALIQSNDQLQVPLWPISPAKLLQTPSHAETQILITHELPDESEAEDDEYVPKEFEFQPSDDDASLTSLSDLGSPATTPALISAKYRKKREALGISSRLNDAEDALFKTPSPKKQARKSQFLPASAIGLRTRSKLPLNDTPLEVLEQQLIPPDITTDMYEWNESDNEDYLQFLKTFAFPSTTAPDHGNDDEEADPEYNVMEDEEDDQDKEEHRMDRAVKVSKKELNELLAEENALELFDDYQLSNDETDAGDFFSIFRQHAALLPKATPKLTTPPLPAEPLVNKNDQPIRIREEPIVPINPSNFEVVIQSQAEPTPIPNSGANPEANKTPVEIPNVTAALRSCVATQTQTAVEEPTITKSEPEILFTESMRVTLRHQIQKHIQLLATTYVISSGHEDPQTVKVTQSAKSLLVEMSDFAELNGPSSAYAVKNIDPAREIVRTWPPRVTSPNNASPIKKKILEEFRSRPNLTDYETSALKLMAENPTFMYPSLLPALLSISRLQPTSQCFTMGEDCLIVRGYHELKNASSDLANKLSLQDIASKLSATLLPVRTPRQILNRIKNERKSGDGRSKVNNSVLKDYFGKQILPGSPVDPFLPLEARPPIQHTPELLSARWRKIVERFKSNSRQPHTTSSFIGYKTILTNGTSMVSSGKRKRSHGIIDATEETPSPDSQSSHDQSSSSTTTTSPMSTEPKIVTVTNGTGQIQFYYAIPAIWVDKKQDAVSKEIEDAAGTDTVVEMESPPESEPEAQDTTNPTTKPEATCQSQPNSAPSETAQEYRKDDEDEDSDDERRERKKFRYDPEPDPVSDFESGQHREGLKEASDEESGADDPAAGYTNAATNENRPFPELVTVGSEVETEIQAEHHEDEVNHQLNTEEEGDLIETLSEGFLTSVRDMLGKKDGSLYRTFLELFNESVVQEMSDDLLYSKAEELLKNYPDLVTEFRGLQSAEAAFTTGNFSVYAAPGSQQELLKLLQHWNHYCPDLKSKIVHTLSFSEPKNALRTHPLFRQIGDTATLASFKAFFDMSDDLTEEQMCTTDEENLNDQCTGHEQFESDTKEKSSPDRKCNETDKTPSSKKRKKLSPSGTPSSSSGQHSNRNSSSGGNKRKKYNTTPMEQLLESNEDEGDDVVEAFSEAFVISVRHRLEGRNPPLYAAFLQIFQDCLTNEIAEEDVYTKVEELLKDYPDLIKEFRGLQSAEVAFSTGNFVQYRESQAQIHFLQLLEKWTVNCPQLKTKIIQKMKSLQDMTDLTETKVVDVMQPLFSQIQHPLILDSFKALFPSIFRPQTTVSDHEFEEVDLDVDDKHESHGHQHHSHPITIEPELDTFETVKIPEEKQVVATNTCPCSCHGDPENIHYHTRARHCNKCCLRFQDGKMYLHSGRVMKPVSIEFPSADVARQVFAPPTYISVKTTRPSSCSPSTSTSTAILKKPGT